MPRGKVPLYQPLLVGLGWYLSMGVFFIVPIDIAGVCDLLSLLPKRISPLTFLLSDIVQRMPCCKLPLFSCSADLEPFDPRLAGFIFSIKFSFQHRLVLVLVVLVIISVSVEQQQQQHQQQCQQQQCIQRGELNELK